MAAYTSPFIGYPGSPKDYSSLEAMRKRQKDVDDKAAKARTDKELDEIMKAIDIDPGKYLPFRIPQVKGIMGEGVDKILKAAAAGDYSALQEAKNEIKLRSGNFVAEKDDFDKVIKSSESGQTFTPADYRIMYSGKGPSDFQPYVDNGSLLFHKDTGRFVPTAFDNVDLPKYMIDVVGKYKNAPTDRIDALGRQIYETDVAGATNALAYTYDNEPAIKAKYRRFAGNSVVKEGRTKEQYEADLRNKFIEDGLGMIQPSRVVKPSKGINVEVNVGSGDATKDARVGRKSSQEFQMTYLDPTTGRPKLGTFVVDNWNATGDKKATFPVSATAYDIGTGAPIQTSENEQYVFNGFGEVYQLTREFTLTTTNGKKTTYKKGTIIPRELVEAAKKNGATEKILGAITSGGGRTIVQPAELFMQSVSFDESQNDQPAITAVFNQSLADLEANKAAEAKSSGGGSSSKPKTNTKPAAAAKTKESTATTEAKKKNAEKIAKDAGITPIRR